MLQLKTDTTIRGRFLFIFLLFTILSGLHAVHACSMRIEAPHLHKQKHYHRFDLRISQLHFPENLQDELPEELTEDPAIHYVRQHESRHRRRFYITSAAQQYSFTTRLQQLQLYLGQYIPADEKKTGIYQWQDAFLPAYYSFLFRYTLF